MSSIPVFYTFFCINSHFFRDYSLLAENQEIKKYQNSKYNTVITECLKVMLLDISHQKLDCKYGYEERYQASHKQNDHFDRGIMESEFDNL